MTRIAANTPKPVTSAEPSADLKRSSATTAAELRMMTFNVAGLRLGNEKVLATIRRSQADVICLQEVSAEQAKSLARALGMHVVHQGDTSDGGGLAMTGKAILSRLPIVNSEKRTYEVTAALRGKVVDSVPKDRRGGTNARHFAVLQAWAKGERVSPAALREAYTKLVGNHTEAIEDRGVLRATVDVGGKHIDILNTHLTLTQPDMNASEMQQLDALAKQRREQVAGVLVAGDFNTNFAIKERAGDHDTVETDTVQEWQKRFGQGVGNASKDLVLSAMHTLTADFRSGWEAATKQTVINRQGEALTHAQVHAQQSAAPQDKTLLDYLDGSTHLGAHKRFDNILVDPRLRVESALIDHGAQASDHSPVVVTVKLGAS